MGLLSAQALAEFRRNNRRAYYAMEATFPDGMRRYAKQSVCSNTQGRYRPRVKQWGDISRSGSDREFALVGLAASPIVIDMDFEFSDMVGSGAKIKNSAVSIKILSPNYTNAQAPTRFTGRLYDWEQAGQLEWTWKLRPPDTQLYSSFPSLTVQKYDFPLAPVDSFGLYVPIIYGLHDSNATSDKGAAPLIRVDGTAFKYLVCRGRALTVMRVYDDGVKVTNWSTVYEERNGRLFTLVDFTTDPGVASAVTADVKGYETVGDGTGTLISDPADELKHLLSNWIYGEYARGPWLATNSVVDTASFTALTAWVARRAYGAAYKGSMWIGEKTTAKQVIDDWCKTHQVDLLWTNAGTIAVKVDDPTQYPAPADPRIVFPKHELGRSFRQLGTGSAEALQKIVLSYGRQASTDSYLGHLELVDPDVPLEATEDLPQLYGPHYL